MTGDSAQRLADEMNKQRLELGLRWNQVAQRAGISTETLYRFRNGLRTEETTRAVEKALEWERGRIREILDRDSAGSQEEAEQATEYDDDVIQRVDSLVEEVRELQELVRRTSEGA